MDESYFTTSASTASIVKYAIIWSFIKKISGVIKTFDIEKNVVIDLILLDNVY